MIRRLKTQGANQSELCDIYNKHVRSILENSAAVWHAGLTQINSTDIERVQKSAFSIILGKHYSSYENALRILGWRSSLIEDKPFASSLPKNHLSPRSFHPGLDLIQKR